MEIVYTFRCHGCERDRSLKLEFIQGLIKPELKKLSVREQKILELHFGMTDGKQHSVTEIGKEFDVTRERISQIIDKAMQRLSASADVFEAICAPATAVKITPPLYGVDSMNHRFVSIEAALALKESGWSSKSDVIWRKLAGKDEMALMRMGAWHDSRRFSNDVQAPDVDELLQALEADGVTLSVLPGGKYRASTAGVNLGEACGSAADALAFAWVFLRQPQVS